MRRFDRSARRGLTLLELTLAMTVTSLIAGAISGMMHAVTMGVGTRRDARTTMVGANAASTRLGAYILPSRCVLDADEDRVVLWFDDARKSGSVHASEVRWILFDAATGDLEVVFVSFPPAWSQVARDLADKELSANADWMAILGIYEGSGWTSSIVLVDGLADVAVTTDHATPRAAHHVAFRLAFETGNGSVETHTAASIRLHQPPTN